MTAIEKAALERTLSEAFCGGELTRRELRLSRAEADYLSQIWGQAVLLPLQGGQGADKSWYTVELTGCPA